MRIKKVGRSAITGRFTTIRKALKRPSTHVVETISRQCNVKTRRRS